MPKYGRRTAERSTSNRFMTQPVTVDEVQEASKLKEEDPTGRCCCCCFMERVIILLLVFVALNYKFNDQLICVNNTYLVFAERKE